MHDQRVNVETLSAFHSQQLSQMIFQSIDIPQTNKPHQATLKIAEKYVRAIDVNIRGQDVWKK